jgi:UDP-glucose:tetrahydrobiopterin glucosyltransferase
MRLLVVGTPLGFIGSGRGGGVELTLPIIVEGMLARGHRVTALVGSGSQLPLGCNTANIWWEEGEDQPSWQHCGREDPVRIPAQGLLGKFWRRALNAQGDFDALLNLSYDWLPFWLSPHLQTPLFHLVTMGSVSKVMDEVICEAARFEPRRVAFLTATQAADFFLPQSPIIVGNGIALSRYTFRQTPDPERFLGWAGRVAPEKGLEDAAAVAHQLGIPLRVWGKVSDRAYAQDVTDSVPEGTIQWRGFVDTATLQRELGGACVFLNTPKWNEAYGNVLIEALACGVPVVAYRRGGPSEIVDPGYNGYLVDADDRSAMATATLMAMKNISRASCRKWVEKHASQSRFAEQVENWLHQGLIN